MSSRILIGVTCCHKSVYPEALARQEPGGNQGCVQAARETWVKDAKAAGIEVRFFYGRQPDGPTLRPGLFERFLNCDDSYNGLIDKVSEMCGYALIRKYDYLLKVDVDSYVNVPNFLNSEFRDWDYTGRGWGLGYVLSRKAMEIVASETQRRSWAEDAHAMRSLFAWGNKSVDNKIKLYGDGRYTFVVNLLQEELELLDTAFIVANPNTPETMHKLHETGRLSSTLPRRFTDEDLWTIGLLRVEHASVFNAFFIRREECPYDYNAWAGLPAYDRQPL